MDFFVLQTWMRARLYLSRRDERGANIWEYAMIVALTAVVVIVAVKVLGRGGSSHQPIGDSGQPSTPFSGANSNLQ